MSAKIGLTQVTDDTKQLINSLESALIEVETDMTIFFRLLAECTLTASFEECWSVIQPSFYIKDINLQVQEVWKDWFTRYQQQLLLEKSSDEDRKNDMNSLNPKYVLRNYMAQLAIDKADEGDYTLIEELFNSLKKPYEEQTEYQRWFAKRPEWARHKVGCSMLSCSS